MEIQIPELDSSDIHSEAPVTLEESQPIRFTPSPHEQRRRNHILDLLERSSDYELFIPTLIRVFEQEPNENIQKRMIQIFGKSKHDSAIHLLVQTLGENNEKLRLEAAKQLIKVKSIDNPNSLKELYKLAEHEDWDISWCAAMVLGHLRDSTILPRMVHELRKHQTSSTRLTAAKILGIIGDPSCVPSLIEAINQDPDRYIRINAACSLSFFGRKEAIPTLLDAIRLRTNIDPHAEIMKSLLRFGIKEPLLEVVISKELYWQRSVIELAKLAKSQRDSELIALSDLFDVLIEPDHGSSNEAIDLLSELVDSEVLNHLIDALENPERYTNDIYFPNRIAFVLVRCNPEIMADKLPVLKKINTSKYIPQLSWLIPTTQNRCKFYNYEIWQAAIQNEELKRQNERQEGEVQRATHVFPNVTEVKIFEQIDTYIENNYQNDPEVKSTIADLQILLTQLQSQHPQVTTEAEAIAILDAEFTEIKQSKNHPRATLRQQLLNPERHWQAIKATSGEVAKHYLEESVWAKAILTYFDKLSESPNYGA